MDFQKFQGQFQHKKCLAVKIKIGIGYPGVFFFIFCILLKLDELRDSTTDVRYLPPEYLVKYRQRSIYEGPV